MKENLYKMWDDGIPLNEAWLEFATLQEKEAFKALPGMLDTFNQHLKIPEQPGWIASIGAISKAFTAGSTASQSRLLVETALKERLLDDLFNDGFLALGYEIPAKPTDKPKLIPSHLFEFSDDIDWDQSSLETLGMVFERIRILAPAAFGRETDFKNADARGEPGRPSKQSEILEVIEFLKLRGVGFNEIPRKEAYGKIKDAARNHFKFNVEIGYSDPTLLRILNRKFGIRR